MKRALVALCFVQFALLLTSAAAWAKPAVAVLGLEVVDDGSGNIDEKSTKLAKELTDALRQRAKVGTGPYSLAPSSEKDLLELKLLSGCDSEADECMASIGKELNADRLLYGKVQKRPAGYQVSLKLLNVDAKKNEKTTSDVVPFAEATGPDLIRWGKVFYNRLTGVTDQGALVIKANVDRGIVYLNGVVTGNLVGGTARIAGIAEGTYQLGIEAEGHLRYEARVNVGSGADTHHKADLESNALVKRPPGTQPPGKSGGGSGGTGSSERPGGLSRKLFWTSLLVTAGSGAAMTITGLQVRGFEADKGKVINDYRMSRTLTPDENAKLDQGKNACVGAREIDAKPVIDLCDKAESRARVTNILIGTTVVGAAATIVFLYKGYISPGGSSESSAPAAAGKRKPRTPNVSVLPTLSPNEVGAGLRIDF